MNEPIAAWEDEGGSWLDTARSAPVGMAGTMNQIGWAEQIKIQVDAEFNRVRAALQSAATRQSGQRQADTQVMIAILEDHRAEVMANPRAGYFIHDWQEIRGQVRELIIADSRYKAIRSRPAPPE